MDALTLLTNARVAGLEVWAEGGLLKVRGPKHLAGLVQTLAEHKADLLTVLQDGPAEPGNSTWAQRAASLVAKVEDDQLRVALRDAFEERAAICEHEGGLPRDDAERIAFEEARDILLTWNAGAGS